MVHTPLMQAWVDKMLDCSSVGHKCSPCLHKERGVGGASGQQSAGSDPNQKAGSAGDSN